MKKLKLAALAMLAMSMAMVSCSDKESTTPSAELSAETPALNIRYINGDSVKAHYIMAQEFKAQQDRIFLEYKNLELSKNNEIEQERIRIAQKYQSGGYLSEASLQSDQQKLEQRYNQAGNMLIARQTEINKMVQEQDSILRDSLHNYLTDLARANGFTVILEKNALYYIDPALDITQAVIEGLNNRYKPAAAPAAEAKK